MNWALAQKNAHPNVSGAMSTLERKIEEESKKKLELDKASIKRRAFAARMYEKFLSMEQDYEIEGRWSSIEGKTFVVNIAKQSKESQQSTDMFQYKLSLEIDSSKFAGDMRVRNSMSFVVVHQEPFSFLTMKYKKLQIIYEKENEALEFLIEEEEGKIEFAKCKRSAPQVD